MTLFSLIKTFVYNNLKISAFYSTLILSFTCSHLYLNNLEQEITKEINTKNKAMQFMSSIEHLVEDYDPESLDIFLRDDFLSVQLQNIDTNRFWVIIMFILLTIAGTLFSFMRKWSIDEALRKVAAEISHDLKNDIIVLRRNVAYIKRKGEALKKDDLNDCLNDLEFYSSKSLERIYALNNINSDPYHKNDYIDGVSIMNMSNEIKRQIEVLGKGIKYETNISRNENAIVKAKTSTINIILHNLINNAIAAIEDRIKNGIIRFMIIEKDEEIIIELSDTGCGIPFDSQDKIFEPKFTRGKVGGTGMGLYITKKLLNEVDGDIELYKTKVDYGTSFKLTFQYLES